MSPLMRLRNHGQSYWLDDLTRQMTASGDLAQRIGSEDLRGVTSNPSIFAKALQHDGGYTHEIADAAARGENPQQIYEELVTSDARSACDLLRPVYDRTDGRDGFASLEVSPHLAFGARASVEEAQRLWRQVDRPNLFIKIPA